MISQQTAGRIWDCYREIAAAQSLLGDMEKTAREFPNDVRCETVKDAFGRHKNLSLGVPMSSGSERLFNVAPALAKSVITAHIAAKKAELFDANEQARIELDTP